MKFEKEYFVNSNTSNYRDYRKKKFDKQAEDLIHRVGLAEHHVIIDYGCATGGLLNSLKERGFAFLIGTDVSDWAINYGQKKYPNLNLQHYNRNLLTWKKKEWIIMLDVLEHMENDELRRVLNLLEKYPPLKGIIVRIPISAKEGQDYVLEVSRNDKTHVQCHCKRWWIKMFEQIGYEFEPLNLRAIFDSEGVMAGVFKHGKD